VSPAASSRRTRNATEGDASTRDRILEVALEAFSELGFDGASTRAIAAGAGVNQGLIPYYFGTKDELWREAVDRAFSELREGLTGIFDTVAAQSGRERLAVMIRRYVDFVARHPEFVRLMNEEGKRDGPRMRWLTDHHVRPLYEGMLRIFREARVLDVLPPGVDPVHLHYIYVGAVATIFHQAHECRRLTGYDPSTPEAARAHSDALIQLLLGDARLGRDAEEPA
jgi:AcrR family transcriptional regulator